MKRPLPKSVLMSQRVSEWPCFALSSIWSRIRGCQMMEAGSEWGVRMSIRNNCQGMSQSGDIDARIDLSHELSRGENVGK